MQRQPERISNSEEIQCKEADAGFRDDITEKPALFDYNTVIKILKEEFI